MPAISPAIPLALPCPKCGIALQPEALGAVQSHVCTRCRTVWQGAVFPALLNPAPAPASKAAFANEGESVCFFHPQNRAVLSCERCGRFVCALCDMPIGSRHLCPACLSSGLGGEALPEAVPARFLWPETALLLGAIPLTIGLPFWPMMIVSGPAAIALALFGWKKPGSLARGRRRWKIVAGLILGLVQTAVWFGVIAAISYLRNR